MSHCVSNLIGIRVGSRFSGPMSEEKQRSLIGAIVNIAKEMESEKKVTLEYGPASCLSTELAGPLGSYVILAGAFNGWTYEFSRVFAQRLSDVCATSVMHMCWDEEEPSVRCNVWRNGKELFYWEYSSIPCAP